MKKITAFLTLLAAVCAVSGANAQNDESPWRKLMSVLADNQIDTTGKNVLSTIPLGELHQMSDQLSRAFKVKEKVDFSTLPSHTAEVLNFELTIGVEDVLYGDIICAYMRVANKKKSGEESDYQKTRYSVDYNDYDGFLARYPSTTRVGEMKTKRDLLKSYQWWLNADDDASYIKAKIFGNRVVSGTMSQYEGFAPILVSLTYYGQLAELIDRPSGSDQDDFISEFTDIAYNGIGIAIPSYLETKAMERYNQAVSENQARVNAAYDQARRKMSWVALLDYVGDVEGVTDLVDSIWTASPYPFHNEGAVVCGDSALLMMCNVGKANPVTITIKPLTGTPGSVVRLTMKPGEQRSVKVRTGRYETVVSTASTVLQTAQTDLYDCLYSFTYYSYPVSDIDLDEAKRQAKSVNRAASDSFARQLSQTRSREYIKSYLLKVGSQYSVIDGCVTTPGCEKCTPIEGVDLVRTREYYLNPDADLISLTDYLLYKATVEAGIGWRLLIEGDEYASIRYQLITADGSDVPDDGFFYKEMQSVPVGELETGEIEYAQQEVVKANFDQCYSLEFTPEFFKAYLSRVAVKK